MNRYVHVLRLEPKQISGAYTAWKESLEDMNFAVEYRLFTTGDTGLFCCSLTGTGAVWGPCFVEVVVSDIGE